MLRKTFVSVAVLLLLLPTVAFADPPDRGDEYDQSVILLSGLYPNVELDGQDGVDAAATAESSGGEAGGESPFDP